MLVNALLVTCEFWCLPL